MGAAVPHWPRRDARNGGRGVLARLERLDGGGDGQDDR